MTTPPATLAVLLDSGPLGLLTHPRGDQRAVNCKIWLQSLLVAGHRILVPEICAYEVRRELRRTEIQTGTPSRGIKNLEALLADENIVPLTSATMELAADLWAQARMQQAQSGPDHALDADVILCAQARLLKPEEWDAEGANVIIATGNIKHLTQFARAELWHNIL